MIALGNAVLSGRFSTLTKWQWPNALGKQSQLLLLRLEGTRSRLADIVPDFPSRTFYEPKNTIFPLILQNA